MSAADAVKTAMDRVRGALRRKPEAAQATKTASCRVIAGLGSEVEIDGHTVRVDMPAVMGGGDTGPNPGGLARAAAASCLAIGYAMTFADRGLSANRIEVTVESDMDLRSGLGLGGHVNFSALRIVAMIDSDDDPQAIREAVAATEAVSMVSQSFARRVPVETVLELNGARAAA